MSPLRDVENPDELGNPEDDKKIFRQRGDMYKSG